MGQGREGWGRKKRRGRREREEGGREGEIKERAEMLGGSEKECQKANTDNSQELFHKQLTFSIYT